MSALPKKIDWEQKSWQFLLGLLCIFFVAKLVNLNTPLFHDELGVYGKAIFYMVDNGASMMPGDVDPEISRGHPLFFAFFVGLISSWFGGSYFVARFVILFLATGLLATTYLLGKELYNKKTGFFAALLLSFQPLFFAQSTLILPEIMLSLLAMLSLLFYLRKQYLWYFIFASLLVLTKETSIVILAGIALNEWYKAKFRINLALIGTVAKWAAPSICFLAFLVVQNMQNGWYLYPYHTELISFSILDVLLRLFFSMIVFFLGQGRFLLTIVALFMLKKMTKIERKRLFEKNFLILAVGVAMFGFSCINYYMPRYFLLIMPLFMIAYISVFFTKGYSHKGLAIYFVWTLLFQVNFFFFRNDDNMSYLIVVKSMQKSIAKLDKITKGEKVKIFVQFPEINALEDVRNGYTTNPNYVLTDRYDETVDYILKSENEHMTQDNFINNTDYNLDMTVDEIINNEKALKASKIELIYEGRLFYTRQRLFKTNN